MLSTLSAVAVPSTANRDLPQPAAAEPEVYIDQLIDPAAEQDAVDPVYRSLMEQPPGRRYRQIELRHYREDIDSSGRSSETGLHLDWRRETYRYGELEMEGALLGVDAAQGRFNDASGGALFTLRQHDFALTDDWLMQNSLGIDRSYLEPVLSGSFRFKLPASLYAGAGTRLASDDTRISVGAGRLGRFDSGQFETFDRTGGSLGQMSLSHDSGSHWQSGAALALVSNAATVVDHQACAGALQYQQPELQRRFQGHVLADSEGATGVWLDGDMYLGNWRQLFGIYRMAPELLWTDVTMANDQQGAYARSELRTLRYQLSGGLEVSTTDISHDPAIIGTRLVSAYLNGSRQLQSQRSVGGTLSLRDASVRDSAPAAADSRNVSLTVYGAQHFYRSITRLQLQLADISNGDAHGTGSGVTWDQSWNASNFFTLTGTLGFETEQGTGNDADRLTAGILIFHSPLSSLRWDANLSWTRVDSRINGSVDANINGSLGLDWGFTPGWEVTLRARVTDVQTDTTVPATGPAVTDRERSLLLSVRNVSTSGRPFDRYGRDTGKTGYGSVSGAVFYDGNRDGIRQPDEAVATGVYVYLDGRYQKVTDRDGRFEFYPVLVGEHSVTLALEDVQLPWTLEDEAPRKTSVSVRGHTTVSFPLVRYDD